MTVFLWVIVPYVCRSRPTASVTDCGTSRPMTWPRITPSIPKWNSGLPIRSSRTS